MTHFAAFFGLLLTELSPGLQRTFWGALDDEEFFVVEGSGVALTPGVGLPGVRPPGVVANSSSDVVDIDISVNALTKQQQQ